MYFLEQEARTANPCLLLSLQRPLPENIEWWSKVFLKANIHTTNNPSRFQEGLFQKNRQCRSSDHATKPKKAYSCIPSFPYIPAQGNLVGREVLHTALLLKELGHLGDKACLCVKHIILCQGKLDRSLGNRGLVDRHD